MGRKRIKSHNKSGWSNRVRVLSLKTLSLNALSSKEHRSNGTLVKWNIGRMEHLSNGTFVEQNIGRMEHWSNGTLVKRTFV